MAFAMLWILGCDTMLSVKNLSVAYGTTRGEVTGLAGVSFKCEQEK